MQHSVTHDGDTVILEVRGELDALTAADLRPTLEGLSADPASELVVDLSGLRLIDSSGVGALVALYKRVRENGGNVKLIGVAAQPLAIFKLLRLDLVFGLDAT
jgi:anti-sigma B factor antagonist